MKPHGEAVFQAKLEFGHEVKKWCVCWYDLSLSDLMSKESG